MKTAAPRTVRPPGPGVPALAAGLIAALRAGGTQAGLASQRRFGITSRAEQCGIPTPDLRKWARPHRGDHRLAAALWASGLHDARILATFIEDPRRITRAQMERWVRASDNWGLTDALAYLFDRTPWAEEKAHAWSARRPEFVKRAGFALMAGMAVHRKELPDTVFRRFLPVIAREADDPRNFVRKAVNWALRQIGKRNPRLRRRAIAQAERLVRREAPSARWVARDALRELRGIERSAPARSRARGP